MRCTLHIDCKYVCTHLVLCNTDHTYVDNGNGDDNDSVGVGYGDYGASSTQTCSLATSISAL